MLAEKGVHLHIAVQLFPELAPLVLILDGLEPVHRRLKMPLRPRVVCRALPLLGFVENPRERLHFAPVVNLCLIEFVLQHIELGRAGRLIEPRRVVVGLERAVDVLRGAEHGFQLRTLVGLRHRLPPKP